MTNKTLEAQFEKLLLQTTSEENGAEYQEPSISKKTIEKAKKYIDLMEQLLQKGKAISLGEPEISRGPKGSVDVYWNPKSKEYGALLNVPASENEAVTYYWEREDKSDCLRGEL